jgi:gliding motility-associated protein GldM
MSLPKEPRQKMINMMYLVLTALLALNVSAEILNAFKTVNTSIGKSNEVITEKNDLTYKSFNDELNDAQTKEKAKIWAPKAEEAKKMSSDLYNYIENLKKRLADESGKITDRGEETFNGANLDAPTRLMDNMGQGKILYESLLSYKQNLLNILKPEEFASDPILMADIKKTKEDFAKQLPLDLTPPKSQSGNASSGNPEKDWTTNYFHMTPSIAAMTILSKFENDVKNSESQMVDYLHKKIGEVKLVYDKFEPLIGTNSTYLMPGDEFDVTAGIGAYSAAAKPVIYINGALQTLNSDGIAEFKSKMESAGSRTMNVKIEYSKPDGSKDVITKDIKYTVGLPSGASIFLEKMNVLYIGEDNPLTISGGSVGREKVHVSFSNGEISPAGGSNPDEWIAKPKTQGDAKIIVNAAGKEYSFPMRVKLLPDPTGFVGTHKGGGISASEFAADLGVISKLDNSEFQSAFGVKSYTIGAVGGGIPQYIQAVNEGPRWNGTAATIVAKATPGTRIFIDEIHVVGKDGRDRIIAPMMFNLK